MKYHGLFALLLISLPLFADSPQSSHPATVSPIPFLSWTDIKDLYSNKVRVIKGKQPGDWDYPKLKSYPNEDELVKFCRRDLELSLKANPDPLQMGRPLPPGGKMQLRSINKDPDNMMVYFVFDYDSELVTDVFIVYYYDTAQGCFILKSRR